MNKEKNLFYFGIVGLCCLGLRFYLKPTLPPFGSLIIGLITAVIGIILLALEKGPLTKGNFFYAYANNWKGAGVVNGSCILGISTFFFSINVLVGISAMILGLFTVFILTK